MPTSKRSLTHIVANGVEEHAVEQRQGGHDQDVVKVDLTNHRNEIYVVHHRRTLEWLAEYRAMQIRIDLLL